MAEITITIKIDGNAVTIAQDSVSGVHVIKTQPQAQSINGHDLIAKRRLPRAFNDQSGGEGPDTTT